MRQLHCPNVLAAATRLVGAEKQTDAYRWALGDALIKDCGGDEHARHRASGHRNNGSLATLEIAAKELKLNGILTYEVNTLRRMRDVALAFPKADRVEGLGFFHHEEANSPECLKWIMKTVPASVKKDAKKRWGIISIVKIREMTQQYYKTVDLKRQRAFEEAEQRAAKATTLDEKRKANEEVERLRGMPTPRSHVAREFQPAMPELRMTAGWLKIGADIMGSARHLQDALDGLHQLKDLHPDHVPACIQDLEEVKKLVLQVDNFLHGRSNVRNIA